MTTVQNRIKKELINNLTTAQQVHQKSDNRATGAYKKTSSSLKHKEDIFLRPDNFRGIDPVTQANLHDQRIAEYQKAIDDKKKNK
jgi:hypothetical protein